MNIAVFFIGVLAIALFLVIFAPSLSNFKKSKLQSAMADIYSTENQKQLSDLKPGSLEYKLAASGINWNPATFRILNVLAAIGAMLLMWSFLPGVPSIAAAILVYYAPNNWLNDKIKNRGREIDLVLPLAMTRISASLSAGRSVSETLDDVANTLDLEGNNPLSPELKLCAAELRTKERTEALMNLASRSPSMSLANLAYLIEGYMDAGGGKYSEIFSKSIDRVQDVLNARNRTRAKASEAMLSAKIMPVVLVLVLAFMAQSPNTQASLRSLPVQIVLGITIGLMATGYTIMRSMIQEAA
jgi:Flp pilus assembly protein TadB